MSGQNKKKKGFPIKNISLALTTVLFIVLFGAGSIAYDNFLSFSTFFNLFNDNAYLIIASIGITFVQAASIVRSHRRLLLHAYFLHFYCGSAGVHSS